jgi:hypothetical protein
VAVASFLALYSGRSLSDARLIAVSSDPEIVGDLAIRLLRQPIDPDEDPAVAGLERGRRSALRLIKREADGADHT